MSVDQLLKLVEENHNLKQTNKTMFELLLDLYEIMPTALNNTHIDLIKRTKHIVKKSGASK